MLCPAVQARQGRRGFLARLRLAVARFRKRWRWLAYCLIRFVLRLMARQVRVALAKARRAQCI